MTRKFRMIVDVDVMYEVVKPKTEASQVLDEFLKKGQGFPYVGGKLQTALEGHREPLRWLKIGIAAGMIKRVDHGRVDLRTRRLKTNSALESDDPHIMALAQIAGARLLHSKDDEEWVSNLIRPRSLGSVGRANPRDGESSWPGRISRSCRRRASIWP